MSGKAARRSNEFFALSRTTVRLAKNAGKERKNGDLYKSLFRIRQDFIAVAFRYRSRRPLTSRSAKVIDVTTQIPVSPRFVARQTPLRKTLARPDSSQRTAFVAIAVVTALASTGLTLLAEYAITGR